MKACSMCKGTGIEPEKRCKSCGLVKPLSDFEEQTLNRDGKSCYCKACENEMIRKYQSDQITVS